MILREDNFFSFFFFYAACFHTHTHTHAHTQALQAEAVERHRAEREKVFQPPAEEQDRKEVTQGDIVYTVVRRHAHCWVGASGGMFLFPL